MGTSGMSAEITECLGRRRFVSQVDLSIAPIGDIDQLEVEWQDLQRRADGSFFLSWSWIGSWLRALKIRPFVLEGRFAGRVVALALLVPARMKRHGWLKVDTLFLNQSGDANIDVITIEYNGFLIDRMFGTALVGRCLDFLCRRSGSGEILPNWDELVLGGVLEENRTIALRSGLPVRVIECRPSAAVRLDQIRASGRSYLDHLSPNTRYQIRRALKLYSARGPLTVVAAQNVAEAWRFLDGLKEFHQSTWEMRGKPGAFAYPGFVKFHADVVERGLPAGDVEVLYIAAGDRPIGYLYNFLFRDWVGYYLGGFAYERDTKAKPGLVSHYLCVERHLRTGRAIYDFMAGQNRYKTSLGTAGPAMVTLVLQKRQPKLMLESGLRWGKTRAKALLARATVGRRNATPGSA